MLIIIGVGRAGGDPETGGGSGRSAVHDAPEQPTVAVTAQVTVFPGQGRQQHVVFGRRGHRV